MSEPTRPSFRRIAMVFDFDGTLAEDTYDAVVAHAGHDVAATRERVDALVDDGWEGALARIHVLSELGVRRERMREVGRDAALYEGVGALFDRMRERAQSHDADLELYLVSAGLGEVIRACPIADAFERIFSCECHFDEDGRVCAAKKIVPHAEKASYLLQIARGRHEVQGNPPDPWRPEPEDTSHVPIAQMVYVGDGLSDMPAFALVNERGGVAIAIARGEDWKMAEEAEGRHRVDNVFEPDYRGDSPLLRALCLAVDMIAARIELRRLGRGRD